MTRGPLSLAAVAREWHGAPDPWTPPVFFGPQAFAAAAQVVEPGERWIACVSDRDAVARAAGCAWARRQGGADQRPEAVVAGPPDRRLLARVATLAGAQPRLTLVAERPDGAPGEAVRWCRPLPESAAPAPVPPGRGDWPAVRLPQLERVRAGLIAAAAPRARPLDEAHEALRQVALSESALVVAAGEPPWQPLDAFALAALAQVAGEGWRPVAVLEGGAALVEVMPAIAAAGLPLVVAARLEAAELTAAVAAEGWWIAEAADRAGLHALLATALLDAAPWLIRLPADFVPDLPPIAGADLHEPGAGRVVVACDRPRRWLVATVAGLSTARAIARLAGQRGIDLALLHASSLRPFPWQAVRGPCAVVEETGGEVLARCAEAEGLAVHAIDSGADPAAALDGWVAAKP